MRYVIVVIGEGGADFATEYNMYVAPVLLDAVVQTFVCADWDAGSIKETIDESTKSTGGLKPQSIVFPCDCSRCLETARSLAFDGYRRVLITDEAGRADTINNMEDRGRIVALTTLSETVAAQNIVETLELPEDVLANLNISKSDG